MIKLKIAKVIQNLDANKVHGHDNIAIPMVKVCCPLIYKPLEIIFNQCLETGVFPSDYSQKRGQADIAKLPSCVVATYMWENS